MSTTIQLKIKKIVVACYHLSDVMVRRTHKDSKACYQKRIIVVLHKSQFGTTSSDAEKS